jgi:hypothetical protein
MPLLDHFHPPLKGLRRWESFHGYWASAIGGALNAGLLPPGYFAEMQVTLGTQLEVDIASMEEAGNGAPPPRQSASKGGVAMLAKPAWVAPRATLDMPAIFPDDIEVLVFSDVGGPTLAGAIELVSPRNKDRPRARRAFASKCLSYLQRGVGVVVVDVVTERKANLHDELARLVGRDAPPFPGKPALYTTAYRPYRRDKEERIAVWAEALDVGQPLPSMPLWLPREPEPVRVDLETTYTEARLKSALPELS